MTAFHSRFTSLRISRPSGECASPMHHGERNFTSTSSKLSKTFSVSAPHPWLSPFRGNGSHHRAIQIEFLPAPKAEDFVDGPFLPHPPAMRTERGGELRAKGLHPVQHRAGGDINIPLG